jgi:hypothetical protein
MNPGLKTLRNLLLVGGFLVGIAVWIFVTAPSSMLVKVVDDGFPLLLNLSGAGLAYGIFRRQVQVRLKAGVWGAMTLGLICWSLGEAIWAIYELVLRQEVPYPSVADIVWLIGYIPLYLSVGLQFAPLKAAVSRPGKLLIASILSGMAILTVLFVIVPILVSPESGPPIELFFGLAYPICDLVLFSFAMVMVLVFLGGQLALSWGVIAAGILLLSFSDLLFSYGTWNGMYYPNGQLNFLSALFDTLYISAYVVWNVGLYLRFRLPEPGQDVDIRTYIPKAGENFLLMVDAQRRVVYADPSLIPILGLKDPEEWMGKSFGQLIGLDHSFEEAATRQAAKTGVSEDYSVSLGLSRMKYRLRAVASEDPSQFPGFDILIHPETPRAEPGRNREALLLGQIVKRAWQGENNKRLSGEEDSLRVYFNTWIDLLYILISRAGGSGIGEAFETVLNEKARNVGCAFEVRNGRAIWKDRGTDPEQYRVLLEEAIRYSKGVVAEATIDRKLRELEKFMDPEILKEAEKNRLMGTWRFDKTSG